jgi:hypothetical protein
MVNDFIGLLFADYEFRRKWRQLETDAGVPKNVLGIAGRLAP